MAILLTSPAVGDVQTRRHAMRSAPAWPVQKLAEDPLRTGSPELVSRLYIACTHSMAIDGAAQ